MTSAPYLAGEPNTSGVVSRQARLAEAASRLRIRALKIPVEQILLIAGSILLPLGIALIILGWEGASHTGHQYEQIDYLISGGLLGIAVTGAGGFMYFGYWLSRQLRESRRQNALTLQALQRLQDAVEAASVDAAAQRRNGGGRAAESVTNGDRRTGRRRRSNPPDAAEDTGEIPAPLLVATPKGSQLHRPDCPVVAGREGVRYLPAGTEGYGYCSMCDAAGVLEESGLGAVSKGER